MFEGNYTPQIPATQYPVDFDRLKTMTAEEVENYFVNELKAFENVKSLRLFIAEMLFQAEQDGSWDLPVVYYEEGEIPTRPATEVFSASVDQATLVNTVESVPVIDMAASESACACGHDCATCENVAHQITMDEYLATKELK